MKFRITFIRNRFDSRIVMIALIPLLGTGVTTEPRTANWEARSDPIPRTKSTTREYEFYSTCNYLYITIIYRDSYRVKLITETGWFLCSCCPFLLASIPVTRTSHARAIRHLARSSFCRIQPDCFPVCSSTVLELALVRSQRRFQLKPLYPYPPWASSLGYARFP